MMMIRAAQQRFDRNFLRSNSLWTAVFPDITRVGLYIGNFFLIISLPNPSQESYVERHHLPRRYQYTIIPIHSQRSKTSEVRCVRHFGSFRAAQRLPLRGYFAAFFAALVATAFFGAARCAACFFVVRWPCAQTRRAPHR